MITKKVSGLFSGRDGAAVHYPGRRLVRFLHLVVHRFVQDGGLHHTASLTYTTLLSLVPLMTVSLAIFSAFPVSDRVGAQLQDFLFQNMVPASGEVIRQYLEEFSSKASRMTGTGSAFLVIVAVMMMATIDRAFNTIWQVRRKRSALSMFMVYWAILSLGPIFMGISVVLTSYFVSMPLFEDAAETLGVGRHGLLWLMPMLASAVAFTLLYMVVPNRSVPLRHALFGGLLAALLFEAAKRGFALYVTTFPTYQAIYGAMAAVPVFLIWIYLSWLVTLLGAEFTYCLSIYRDRWDPEREHEREDLLLAYRLLEHLWEAQREGKTVSMQRLLALEPTHSEVDLEHLLLSLRKARLVLYTERDEWALARDMGGVSLLDLYRAGSFVFPADTEVGEETELGQVLGQVETDLQRTLDLPLSSLFGKQRVTGEAGEGVRRSTAKRQLQ